MTTNKHDDETKIKVMTLEDLRKEIQEMLVSIDNNAKKEIKEMAEMIEREHQKRVREIELNYNKKLEQLEQELKILKDKELQEKKSLLNIELKRATYSAKEKAVDNSLIELRNLMIKERGNKLKEEYAKFVTETVKKHIREFEDFKINCGEVEYEILKQTIPELTDKLVLSRKIYGFVITNHDGNVGYNYTIDSLLEDKKEYLKQKIYHLLFTN